MKNMKYILIAVVCIVTIAGFIAVGKSTVIEVSGANSTPTPTPGPRFYTTTKPMPAELAYWVLFQEVRSLKNRDLESQAEGETTNFKTSFYSDRLGLESSQFSAVDNAVNECFTNLQPVDQRAREIINQYRSNYPNGQLKKIQPTISPNDLHPARPKKSFESLPPVPAEIGQLQNQKNQIILNAKEKIRQALGQSEFAEFDASVQKNAHKVLIPRNLATKQLPTPTPRN